MPFTLAEIAKTVGGEIVGDPTTIVHRFAPADRAEAGDLTFAENENYFARAEQSAATAIIVDAALASRKPMIRVQNARIAFAKILPLFFPETPFQPGIHPTAVIDPSAAIDASAHIGPHCVIGENVRIGRHAVLQGGNFIGASCHVGEDSNLFPNVVLYPRTEVGNRVRIHAGAVLGSDGFGYVLDCGTHRKVPQIGSVIVRDDVEIGANTTIDRGALGPTIIGKGTKIDNLVQVGHNVITGENCMIISQVGIAGSTKLGNYVTLAGQVGLAGHLRIGNRVAIAAQSGVMSNIPDGEKWMGSPASPDRQAKRQVIAVHRLPELLKRISELEKKCGIVRGGAVGADGEPRTTEELAHGPLPGV